MEQQIKELQKKIRQLQLALAGLVLMVTAVVLISFTTGDKNIIRTRGIIVEDASGKPFIMMGNPIPDDARRSRKDPMAGLVFVDARGTDRLYMGKDAKLQMGGQLVDRDGNGWSYLVNDTIGDERGGFGYSDADDRIGLGLDYGGKDGLEAIYLNASQTGAYITVNANVAQGTRDRIVLWHDTPADLTQIKIGDKTADDRVLLKAANGTPAIVHKTNGKRTNLAE